MQSLVSCVPRRFIQSIEGDKDVVIMFLKELWPRVVGEEIARNTEPVRLTGEALAVRVNSAVWANQLAGLRSMMIGSINKFWGGRLVETIRLEVDL